ncbi:MAG: hypothetical protein ABSH20_05550 [Tepidisphaeraceae bacterium]
MPAIRPYPDVLLAMQRMGLVCNYHNSGAFGFPRGSPTVFCGWVSLDDPSIQPAAREFARQVPPPHEANLARMARDVWLKLTDGPAWIVPMSHWAFEMDHGSRDWLPGVLGNLGIDAAELLPLSNAAAIEFGRDEADAMSLLVENLLTRLTASDFALLFREFPLVCTIHHHKQLWWVCQSEEVLGRL